MVEIEEIILASRNQKKFHEFVTILKPLGIRVRSVLEFPDILEVEESGKTFKENAALKAEIVAAQIGGVVLADDSGLSVDFLGGEPGVYSARYSGEEATDGKNNDFLLQKLAGVPEDERGAEFVCVLALTGIGEETLFFEGNTRGRILTEIRGEAGFGYDPLFFSTDLGVTFSEAEEQEKNRVSHRGRAVNKLLEWLKNCQ